MLQTGAHHRRAQPPESRGGGGQECKRPEMRVGFQRSGHVIREGELQQTEEETGRERETRGGERPERRRWRLEREREREASEIMAYVGRSCMRINTLL